MDSLPKGMVQRPAPLLKKVAAFKPAAEALHEYCKVAALFATVLGFLGLFARCMWLSFYPVFTIASAASALMAIATLSAIIFIVALVGIAVPAIFLRQFFQKIYETNTISEKQSLANALRIFSVFGLSLFLFVVWVGFSIFLSTRNEFWFNATTIATFPILILGVILAAWILVSRVKSNVDPQDPAEINEGERSDHEIEGEVPKKLSTTIATFPILVLGVILAAWMVVSRVKSHIAPQDHAEINEGERSGHEIEEEVPKKNSKWAVDWLSILSVAASLFGSSTE